MSKLEAVYQETRELHRLIKRGTTYGPSYEPNAFSEADDEVPRGAHFLFISAKAMATIECEKMFPPKPPVFWSNRNHQKITGKEGELAPALAVRRLRSIFSQLLRGVEAGGALRC